MISNEQQKFLTFGFPSETWRQVVLENALDAVIGVNSNDEIIDWNRQAEAIFSWNKSEVLGKSLAQTIIPEHQREAHARGMKHFFATGNGPILNRRIEVTALHRSGRTFPAELTVIPILIDGSYIFYSFVRDITDRKLAEQSHKDLELWSKTVLNRLPVPVILTVLSSGEVVFINETAIALDLKLPMNAIGFQSCDSYFTDSSGFKIPFAEYPRFRAARGESYSDLELNWKTPDKTHVLLFSGKLLPAMYGHPALCMTVYQDITCRKEAEVLISKGKEAAERANDLKSTFLANMSHEIRTPLGAMLGFADLLKDSNLLECERDNYLNILSRNGEQLSLIINDILDLSKVEAGHLALEYSQVSPQQVAEEVVKMLSVKVQEKHLTLDVQIDPSTPTTLVTDPLRLRQILLNIIGNAIKFTQAGGILLKIFSDGDTGIVSFEVTDSGIGVPPEQAEKIFEMFVQADGSMTRKFGGTGLGLSLSRKLARSLGGDIIAKKTNLDHGSVFQVTVKNEITKTMTDVSKINSPTKTQAPYSKDFLKSRTILVVDDAADNRHLICRYLVKQGAHVDFASNGLEGVEKAMMGSHDLVIMDIQMPIMDGYEATRKLREQSYNKPIIALTAHAMPEVRSKCLAVGCTDQLTKPINSEELLQTIARLFGIGLDSNL